MSEKSKLSIDKIEIYEIIYAATCSFLHVIKKSNIFAMKIIYCRKDLIFNNFSNIATSKNLWKRKIAGNFIFQIFFQCGRYFRIAKNAYQHIKECKGANEKYSCKLCGKVLLSMPGMKNHILSKHRRVSLKRSVLLRPRYLGPVV